MRKLGLFILLLFMTFDENECQTGVVETTTPPFTGKTVDECRKKGKCAKEFKPGVRELCLIFPNSSEILTECEATCMSFSEKSIDLAEVCDCTQPGQCDSAVNLAFDCILELFCLVLLACMNKV